MIEKIVKSIAIFRDPVLVLEQILINLSIKMFRCVTVALLLINAYNGSLGAPMPNEVKSNLTELANRCTNLFLRTQIISKVSECNIYKPKTEKEFQCNIFYDINAQLCDAVAASKLNITEEEHNTLNDEIRIDKFCQEFKKYKPTNSTYEAQAAKVFDYNSSCIKSCSTDDITNLFTSYYCKYYKWGKDLLESSQGVTTPLAVQTAIANSTYVPEKNKVSLKDVPIDTQSKSIISGVTSMVHTSSTNTAKSVKPTSVVKHVEVVQQEVEKNKENEQDDKDDLEISNGGKRFSKKQGSK